MRPLEPTSQSQRRFESRCCLSKAPPPRAGPARGSVMPSFRADAPVSTADLSDRGPALASQTQLRLRDGGMVPCGAALAGRVRGIPAAHQATAPSPPPPPPALRHLASGHVWQRQRRAQLPDPQGPFAGVGQWHHGRHAGCAPPPHPGLHLKGRRPQKRLDRRLEEVAEAVGGRLLSATNAIEAGTWRQGDSGWA